MRLPETPIRMNGIDKARPTQRWIFCRPLRKARQLMWLFAVALPRVPADRIFLITDRHAVLAHLGGSPIGAVPLIAQDGLVPAVTAPAHHHRMTTLGELCPDRWSNSRLHIY